MLLTEPLEKSFHTLPKSRSSLYNPLRTSKPNTCNYRQCILYPLRLGPPFPNDAEILRPKIGLGPNQMLKYYF